MNRTQQDLFQSPLQLNSINILLAAVCEVIILFIFHFCGVGEVSQGWRRGLVAVRFSCWKHLTDAVVCAAAGRTVSQGIGCIAAPPA